MALRFCRAGVDTPYVLLSTPLMRKLVLSERTDVPRPCEGSKTLHRHSPLSQRGPHDTTKVFGGGRAFAHELPLEQKQKNHADNMRKKKGRTGRSKAKRAQSMLAAARKRDRNGTRLLHAAKATFGPSRSHGKRDTPPVAS